METERVSRAITRIQEAAARIERGAAEMASRQPASDGASAREEALRENTQAALAELDRLIADISQ
ncbi:hypothetical protein [Paraurantiacibacter namhicola]|uniref:Uncharacterized protein n=1 Tax=Paraurantiacibacter namhicola TaxID=645517 RepID=A0A1C7D8T3_9SPHN|nr:hypothetical protein [Paraurantiacibacter namhicola]ANU07847.1 hypothetical protein A6F65_01546 [Paraurantiacibacter namhicola]